MPSLLNEGHFVILTSVRVLRDKGKGVSIELVLFCFVFSGGQAGGWVGGWAGGSGDEAMT